MVAVVVLVIGGGALAVLTDTPAEIRLRDQLGLEHPCLPVTVDSEGWREEDPLPSKVDEGRAVALDGKIYLAGGTARLIEYGNPSEVPGVREEVRAESLDQMLRFDPETGTYERMAPMPERLNHQVMAVHDGKIYVAGGSGDLLFGADPRDTLFEYDPESDRWRELEPMPTPRLATGNGVIGDKLYVAGGMGSNGKLSSALEAYDFETGEWETLADIPTPREHVASAVLDGRLYVMGGRTLEVDSLSTVERYDPETDTWESVTPLRQRAGSFDGQAFAGRVLAIAGDDDREDWVTGALQSFDPATERWSQLPEMRTKRHGFASAIVDDRLWTFGGSPCARFAASDIVESFDLSLAR
jgi:outer membrane protein assembly factor BamB